MSRGAGTVVIAGAVISAVALGGWLWMSSSDPDSPDDAPTSKRERRNRGGQAPQASARSTGSLETRVASLEDEVAELRRELKRVRMHRGSAAARGATPDPDGADTTRESPAFEGAVRDIIENEREEAREKRTDAMRERFSDRHTEILDELVVAAGLADNERESIEGLWETESEQLIPMFMAARSGDRPFREVREEADKLRAATDASVEDMLSPEQFEQYKEMRPGPPRGGRRRGPPPG